MSHFCTCLVHCTGGKVVSKSTFYGHAKYRHELSTLPVPVPTHATADSGQPSSSSNGTSTGISVGNQVDSDLSGRERRPRKRQRLDNNTSGLNLETEGVDNTEQDMNVDSSTVRILS